MGKCENRNLLEIEERGNPAPIARIQGVYRKAVSHVMLSRNLVGSLFLLRSLSDLVNHSLIAYT